MFNKFTVSILLVAISLNFFIKPLDRSSLESSDYYLNTIKSLEEIKDNDKKYMVGDTIRVGWAKASLVPDFLAPMAGYGARKGQNYEGVNDSIWVRAVAFDNGINKSVYVSMDLLIVPPNLDRDKLLEGTPFKDGEVYFTASHTHSSIGGFLEGIAGEIFGGKYEDKNLDFITLRTKEAIMKAYDNIEVAKIGYAPIFASDFITNRLVGDSIGTYDPYIRLIKIIKDNGESAAIFSYSAHATCHGHEQKKISGDYPGKLISMLEETKDIDFAVYGAGAVGSMSPRTFKKDGDSKVREISGGLYDRILPAFRSIGVKYENILKSQKYDIELREQSFKINSYLIVRPWLFKFLVGDTPKYISSLRLGDLIMIGTPSDFSGELIAPIEKSISNKELNLIVNSFNGGYIGYITDDKWYDRTDINTYETYTMNWYGPYNGLYFSILIKKIIELNENN